MAVKIHSITTKKTSTWKVRECWLPFSSECFIFSLPI